MISFQAAVKKTKTYSEDKKIDKEETGYIRELAYRYKEACESKKNLERKNLWERFNALENTRTPFLIQYDYIAGDISNMLFEYKTNSLRHAELFFLINLWHFNNIDDDLVLDPWISVNAQRFTVPGTWGIEQETKKDPLTGSFTVKSASLKDEDLNRLIPTPHIVINERPKLAVDMTELLEGVLPVHITKGSVYRWWNGIDLSETLFRLLGYEGFLIDMYDRPDFLHRLLSILRDGVLNNLEEVSKKGDFAACDMYNHAMLHTKGFDDLKPNEYTGDRTKLWLFMHAQEFDVVGPDLFEEFMFEYQLPIMQEFGLISYGCCEALDNKMHILRRLPNLRRVCAGPTADLAKSVDSIGRDYIISWRPKLNLLTSGYDPHNIAEYIKRDIHAAKGTHFEMLFKDIMTVDGHPQRLIEVSQICRVELNRQ